MRARTVLFLAIVFALAMGALEHGGWWWAWLTGTILLIFRRGIRLPLMGIRLRPTTRYIIRENHLVRRRERRAVRRIQREKRRRRRARRRVS